MKNKIAATVIFYKPTAENIKNIFSYVNDVGCLYIYDNSENSYGTEIFRMYNNIRYIFNNENLGISRCLNLAACEAIKNGYEWLLTMDQDSAVPPNYIEGLFSNVGDVDKIGIISPFHQHELYINRRVAGENENVLYTMTSGNLLNLSAYQIIGKFNEIYFIDYVDIEYCFRLIQNGYRILRQNNVLLSHNEGNLELKKNLFFSARPYNHNPLRWYYKSRNFLYLNKSFKNKFPGFFLEEKIKFIKDIIKILLFEDKKLYKYKYIVRGILDYRAKISGRIKNVRKV